jgi:hypothetical protein
MELGEGAFISATKKALLPGIWDYSKGGGGGTLF